MASKLRFGVAGTGSFTRRVVVPGLKASGRAEVVALYGRTPLRVEELAVEAGIPERHASFESMLASDSIDAVAVCSPNFLHAPMAKAALEAGKLVLSEKPLGIDASETLELVKAARRTGLGTAVNFTYRSMPAFALAKEMIDAGEMGTIVSGWFDYSQANWANPEMPLDWHMQDRESGGGALADLGSHAIDLMRWLVGEVTAVCGATAIVHHARPIAGGGRGAPTASETATFICDSGEGRLFAFHLSKLAWGHANQLAAMLSGTRGSLRLFHERGREITLEVASSGEQEFKKVEIPEERRVAFADFPGHHMRNAIRGMLGESEFATFEDGHAAQRVIDAVRRSQAERAWGPVETDL